MQGAGDSNLTKALILAARKAGKDSKVSLPTSLSSLLDGLDAVKLALPDFISRHYEEAIKLPDGPEKEYRLYQKDLILENILPELVQEAERRRAYYSKLTTLAKKREEIERCKDYKHFFSHWAYTFDPKNLLLAKAVPFKLFPFQEELLDKFYDVTFVNPRPLLVAKSREMGLSWLGTCFIVWAAFFGKPGIAIHLGSMTEAAVESQGNLASLFGKIIYQLNCLPDFLEANYSYSFGKVISTKGQSVITGQAPVPGFSRGGRYSLIWLDEFAHWPQDGVPQELSMLSAANARIYVSTPNGRNNEFYRLYSMEIEQIEAHWSKDPRKDNRWLQYQSKLYSPRAFAQEVEIDFTGSEAGLVFPHFSEPHSVITWTEFNKLYPFRVNGRPMIPSSWSRIMTHDKGATEEHRAVFLWLARPPEGDRLADSIFIYRQYMAPVRNTANSNAIAIAALETQSGERTNLRVNDLVNRRLMSHEDAQGAFTYDELSPELKMQFVRLRPGKNAGIDLMSMYMDVIDGHRSNPFRPFLQGRSRLYLIVDDEQGSLSCQGGKWIVKDPYDDRGMFRLRKEIPRYVYDEDGRIDKRPGMHDDAIDAARQAFYEMTGFLPRNRLHTDDPLAKIKEELAKLYPNADPVEMFERERRARIELERKAKSRSTAGENSLLEGVDFNHFWDLAFK